MLNGAGIPGMMLREAQRAAEQNPGHTLERRQREALDAHITVTSMGGTSHLMLAR
jgi:hypothetical protein